jgi:hypothetical protein
VSVITHKVLDHHLHCEWQWLAAITPPLTLSAPNVGVDKVFNNILQRAIQKIYFESVAFKEAVGILSHDDIGWHKPNYYKI